MTARVLVVDDEPDLLELVRVNLAQSGYTVETAASGSDALTALRRAPPDVMILDLMLPDLSGTEVCARVRADQRLAALPIIMLTAKSEEIDRVVGLELGADDYVTKPFSPRELALRVRAVLRRRAPTGEGARVLEHDALRVDPDSHRASVDGREITLTAKEFQLLVALMGRPGRVMTRERLLDEVWGSDITVTSRTIDTHLKRLREKLGRAGDLIETVRGVGYRFAE
ncbi:MAG TPA: response regulator [Myxococcota bacterium]|nr:response regulator [Myxococcota bacterium]